MYIENENISEFAQGHDMEPLLFNFSSSEISYQLTTLLPLKYQEDAMNVSNTEVNLWSVFDEQYLRHNIGWTAILVLVYALIFITGVIGNVMVILVVIKRKQMRTVTNMFIVNLAVADLFVIVFCVPVTLLSNIFIPWVLGSAMCKGAAYVQGVSVCASAYSLAAISLDRCKAIYRPMERPSGLSKSHAMFTISLIWLIAILLTIPWVVIFKVVASDRDGLFFCVEKWDDETHGKIHFLVANLFFCYIFPLILISVSNVKIWCHVSHRKVPKGSAADAIIRKMHHRTRQGVRKMLGIVTLAFCLSWLPLYILVTRLKFVERMSNWESNLLSMMMPCAQLLGSLNSCVNPMLYTFLNSRFREMFKSLLPSWIPCIDKNDLRIIPKKAIPRTTVTNCTLPTASMTQSCEVTLHSRSSTLRSQSNGSSPGLYQYQNSHGGKSLLVSSVSNGSRRIVVLDKASALRFGSDQKENPGMHRIEDDTVVTML